MSKMKQNQQMGIPSGPGRNPLEQGSDDRAEHLVAEARKLQAEAEALTKVDPRRSLPVNIVRGGTRTLIYINNTLWAEVDWSHDKRAFCIQDCLGYCLNHVEHIVMELPCGEKGTRLSGADLDRGMDAAIEVAKQMIVDGRMRSPEDAKKFARQNNTSARSYYGL